MTTKKKKAAPKPPDAEQVYQGDPEPSVVFHSLNAHLVRQDAMLSAICAHLGIQIKEAV